MMQDAAPLLALATAGLAATGMTAITALKGWQDWLSVRRAMIEQRHGKVSPRQTIRDLRARVRRLESIANGDAA